MKIAVVDYGLGNIFSVVAALKAIGISGLVDIDGTYISKCDAVLVPGVAAFGAGMRKLKSSGQADALREHNSLGKTLVGLCLGAQMFMEGSEESLDEPGLGFVSGRVVRLDNRKCTVPNQGWLRVEDCEVVRPPFSRAVLGGDYFYFSHSYRVESGPSFSTLGRAASGNEDIVAVYQADNVLGIQFHPERSGAQGLSFLAAALAL